MKPADLLALLQGFYRDKLALYRRHEAGAQQVRSYEFNNAYQYVLAREAVHLEWLRSAIQELGAVADESAPGLAIPAAAAGAPQALAVLQDDLQRLREFAAGWKPRVEQVSNARHRKMLELVLGEVAEHQRFFEQAAAGRLDLLGRRPATSGTGGGVLATRWLE